MTSTTNRYAPENLVYFDFESHCPVEIRRGAYRYAIEARAILLSYAIGMGPVQLVDRRGLGLTWADMPEDLRMAFEAGLVFCAWNTGFDRAIWNYSVPGSPLLAPGQVIDARAAALAHNLPDDLEHASKRLGGPGKQKDGKIADRQVLRRQGGHGRRRPRGVGAVLHLRQPGRPPSCAGCSWRCCRR